VEEEHNPVIDFLGEDGDLKFTRLDLLGAGGKQLFSPLEDDNRRLKAFSSNRPSFFTPKFIRL
jgi:hypothetical protein